MTKRMEGRKGGMMTEVPSSTSGQLLSLFHTISRRSETDEIVCETRRAKIRKE